MRDIQCALSPSRRAYDGESPRAHIDTARAASASRKRVYPGKAERHISAASQAERIHHIRDGHFVQRYRSRAVYDEAVGRGCPADGDGLAVLDSIDAICVIPLGEGGNMERKWKVDGG
ncbi:MAG: hypothetical protein MdMp014T_2145 [Treponematales bacterium]